MINNKVFSISLKLALVIFIMAIIMLFIVKPLSAEFYILIITAALMLIMIVVGTILIRKEKR